MDCLLCARLVLILGSVLGLSVPVFMYTLFRTLITKEDASLERRFGREYLEYRRSVNAVFPRLCRSR
jgi:protein-S-isoprenylcysteine O-methyltransferase Ste14